MDESEMNAAELAGIDLIRESIGRKIYRIQHGKSTGVIRSHCVDEIVDELADRARNVIREKQDLISEVRRLKAENERKDAEIKRLNEILNNENYFE